MFGRFIPALRRWLVSGLLVFLLLGGNCFAFPAKLGDLDSDGVLTVLDLTRLNAHIQGTAPLGSPLAVYADVNQDGFVNDGDVQALVRGILAVEDTAALPLAGVRETSPLAGEGGVAVTREAIVRFTMPLSLGAVLTTFDANTQTPGHLYAEAGGRKLLTRVELSGDRLKATLFFLEPVPASSRVSVTFDGTGVLDLLGRPIDSDGDAQPGGELTFAYDTVPISPVPGTGVIGQIFASQVVAGQAQDTPLAGVTITVDGAEETLRTVTGADGRFSLNPCPAGRFFVFIDGRTATNNVPAGAYYAFVGKAWEAQPGKADNLAAGTGTIYLPLIPAGTLKPVSATEDTTITFPPSVLAQNPALAGVEIEVPANSLFADNGARGGSVGIAPVSPDRLPEPLPPGLEFPMVITIQTDGATNFDRPVPVKFLNLPDPVTGKKLAPGEKSAWWSFNHDTGTWEIQGPMTVTEDGNFVVTDVGVGVRQPGWGGARPATPSDGPGPSEPKCPPSDIDYLDFGMNLTLAAGDCAEQVFKLNSTAKAILNVIEEAQKIKDELAFLKKLIEEVRAGRADKLALRLAINEVRKGLDKVKEVADDVIAAAGPLSKITGALECVEDTLGAFEDFCEGVDEQPECFSTLGRNTCFARQALEDAARDLRRVLQSAQGAFTQLAVEQAEDLLDKIEKELDKEPSRPPQPPLPPLPVVGAAKSKSAVAAAADDPVMADLDQLAAHLTNLATIQVPASAANRASIVEDFLVNASTLTRTMGTIFTRATAPVPRAYLKVEYNNIVLRFRADSAGSYRVVLPPNTPFVLKRVSPSDFKLGILLGESSANGVPTPLSGPAQGKSPNTDADSDSDGLSDEVEDVIGSSPDSADTDGDGILDGEEVRNGNNPLSRIIAVVDTPGYAKDVAALNGLALVADGEAGVCVFNVANPGSPIRVAQVDTPGDARAVALSGTLGAVADGSAGLAVISLSDPAQAEIIGRHQFGSSAESVAVIGSVAYVGLASGQVAVVDMLAGLELERIFVAASTVFDLALSGTVLYAVTAGKLHAIPLAGDTLAVAGTANFSGTGAGGRRLRLFAGGGLAYVATANGVQVFSLANPTQPAFVSTSTAPQIVWSQLVANGSGLGLAAASVGGVNDVTLFDLSPNGTGAALRATFQTTGIAEAVSIFNGLGFIADGSAGFAVVNYLASDALRQPPAISLVPSFTNAEAEEGKLVSVAAAVTDDVQVRNVEFYLDGQLAVTDGNFPFEHRFITPLLTPQKTSFTLRAKATDTGGNSTWSDTLTVTLTADATPPHATRFNPANGSTVGKLRTLSVGFSEPIQPTTANSNSLVLASAGADGLFDTADDQTLPPDNGITYLESTRTVVLNFVADLPPARYRLTARTPLADLPGNAMAAPANAIFRALDFTDADRDGVPDNLEPALGLNPNTDDTDRDGLKDGAEDFDNDGLRNASEVALGLDPVKRDTDGNGIIDGEEDPDRDGLSNRLEDQYGTEILIADSDGDLWVDGAEIDGDSDPLASTSKPRLWVTGQPSVSVVVLASRDPSGDMNGLGFNTTLATPGVSFVVLKPLGNGGFGEPAAPGNTFLAQPALSLTLPSVAPEAAGASTYFAEPKVTLRLSP